MNASKLIAAEEIVAVTAYAAGDLIGQGQGKSLPSPKAIIGLFAFFGGLAWVSTLGHQAARISSGVGAIIVLVMVLRPAVQFAFGDVSSTLIGFISTDQPQSPAGGSQQQSGVTA